MTFTGFQLIMYRFVSLAVLFGPFIVLRILNFYRLKIAQRPTPRPVPKEASRALNILFVSFALFLFLSLPSNPFAPAPNIFELTNSALGTNNEILFDRLSVLRPAGLTAHDLVLKSTLASQDARNIYLKFGQEAFFSCPFCSVNSYLTNVLFYLPVNVLIPHLLHLLVIGLATSAPIAGRDASTWRSLLGLGGILFAAGDIALTYFYDPYDGYSLGVQPYSLHCSLYVARFLLFTLYDGLSALLVYLTVTCRLFYIDSSQAELIEGKLTASAAALILSKARLQALSASRNAIVQDKLLWNQEREYWDAVASGKRRDQKLGKKRAGDVWADEEVARVVSKVMNGNGDIDVAKMNGDMAEHVAALTEGLESVPAEVLDTW